MRRAFLRRRKTWLFALVAMLAIVAAVYYQRSFPAQAESIDTVTLDRGDIEKVVLASGIIKPAVQVSVGAQVSGQLRKLYVRQGERVRKGQLLAEIDPDAAAFRLTQRYPRSWPAPERKSRPLRPRWCSTVKRWRASRP
ncbi:macrolide-specific efflux protein MacA [Klebsiella michiganensis]|uniref:Macrolide-specific efflux protein MacA n=1 Tax=Klebsiella michiganensis TaxID=1134687 RepID=A0A7H4MT60_9ENTR|nr:macrolide-specific efflux protein MacA [Klebsiella michiganensis]